MKVKKNFDNAKTDAVASLPSYAMLIVTMTCCQLRFNNFEGGGSAGCLGTSRGISPIASVACSEWFEVGAFMCDILAETLCTLGVGVR